jgi:predicted RNA-binding protein with PUA-like domain
MNSWLMKTEPNTFSINHLKNLPKGISPWDGVRNYQARNFMRDAMKVGDEVFIYHSNCEIPGIYGMAKVASTSYPDPTQWDPSSKYFDPTSTKEKPRWFLVDVKWVSTWKTPISLHQMKENKSLGDFLLLKKGNRLSILPVTTYQHKAILAMQ